MGKWLDICGLMGDDSGRLQAAWRRKNEQLVENGMRLLEAACRLILSAELMLNKNCRFGLIIEEGK